MAIAFSATLASVADANNLTSYPLTGTVTAAVGDLVMVALVRYSAAGSSGARVSISDTSGTTTPAFRWVQVLRQDALAGSGNNPGIALFAATCQTAYSSTLTVVTDQQMRGLIAGCWKVTGASLAAPFRSSNLRTWRAATSTTTSLTLPRGTVSGTGSVCLCVVAHQANETTVMSAGFTELIDLAVNDPGNTTGCNLSVMWRVNVVTCAPSWTTTSAPYAIGIVELQEAAVLAAEDVAKPAPLWLVEVTPALA